MICCIIMDCIDFYMNEFEMCFLFYYFVCLQSHLIRPNPDDRQWARPDRPGRPDLHENLLWGHQAAPLWRCVCVSPLGCMYWTYCIIHNNKNPFVIYCRPSSWEAGHTDTDQRAQGGSPWPHRDIFERWAHWRRHDIFDVSAYCKYFVIM